MSKVAELIRSQQMAESALLGSLLSSTQPKDDVAYVTETLGDNGWANAYGPIWDTFRSLASDGKNADAMAVWTELVRLGHEDRVGGFEKYCNIIETCPTFDVKRWTADVFKFRSKLKALSITDQVKEKIVKGEDVGDDVQNLYVASTGSEEAKKKPPGWQEMFKTSPKKWGEIVNLIDVPIPYIVQPLIVRGSMTQIQGDPKGGKSSFSLYLSLCCASGNWPQPQHLVAEKPLKVLYLAWEDPALMMAKRLSLYAKGLGFERNFHNDNLTFLFGPDVFVDMATGEENLKAAIRELEADVVFIDTLSHIHRGEENDATQMKIPMKALDRIAKEMNIGLVYLHHTNKNGEGKGAQERGRGSGAIAAAWHIMVDWGRREDGSNINPVQVQSKFEHDWIKWAITYDAVKDETGHVTSVKWTIDTMEEGVEDKGAHATKIDRLIKTSRELLHIGDGWFTAYDMTEKSGLGIESRSIKRHLQKLCEGGWLEFKEGSGTIPNKWKARMGGNLE
jgi:hypothetical protein